MRPERTPELVTPRVAFEVERFDWAAPDRLELVGRWFGLRGHRFLRPTLDVEVDGERRRMLAVLEHKPWAAEDGEEWVAAFSWRGEPLPLDDAELTVSPDVAVQLPVPERPGGGAPATAPPAADRLPARRPRMAVLEQELSAARADAERLREELQKLRESRSEGARELRERVAAEQAKARAIETELEQAREKLAAADVARSQADAARERAITERDAAREEAMAAREAAREEAMAERDAARAERDAAVAARDAATDRLTAAEREHESLLEARDRARQERNAWMSRARAATSSRPSATPPAPPAAAPPEAEPPTAQLPASERRTIQIGERPGPARPATPAPFPPRRGLLDTWGPRLVAVVALAVIAVVIALLLAWAL